MCWADLSEGPVARRVKLLAERYPFLLMVRDTNNRKVRLDLLGDKSRGSWKVYMDGRFVKVADWPTTSYAKLLGNIECFAVAARASPDALRQMRLTTVSALLDWYEPIYAKKPGITKATKRSALGRMRNWLRPCLGDVEVLDLDADLCKRLLVAKMVDKGMGASSISVVFSTLKGAVLEAYRLDMVLMCPLLRTGWKALGMKIKRRPKRLSPGDEHVLLPMLVADLEHTPVGAMAALFMLLYGTRINETRLLRWDDVLFERRLIRLRACHTKSKKTLELPLTDEALRLLSLWRERVPRASSYLFPARYRGVIKLPTLAGQIGRLATGWKGELPWCPHDLRRLMRECLDHAGVESVVAESLVSHELPDTYQRYTGPVLEAKKRAALECWHGAVCLDLGRFLPRVRVGAVRCAFPE